MRRRGRGAGSTSSSMSRLLSHHLRTQRTQWSTERRTRFIQHTTSRGRDTTPTQEDTHTLTREDAAGAQAQRTVSPSTSSSSRARLGLETPRHQPRRARAQLRCTMRGTRRRRRQSLGGYHQDVNVNGRSPHAYPAHYPPRPLQAAARTTPLPSPLTLAHPTSLSPPSPRLVPLYPFLSNRPGPSTSTSSTAAGPRPYRPRHLGSSLPSQACGHEDSVACRVGTGATRGRRGGGRWLRIRVPARAECGWESGGDAAETAAAAAEEYCGQC